MSKLAKFAFSLGDRVMITPECCNGFFTDKMAWPDFPLQGIVSSRKETIGWPNEYGIHFLLSDLQQGYVTALEAELLAAQPTATPSDLKSPARKRR